MPAFRDIIGHEQIIHNFKNSVRTDQVSHAYILNGPDGSGKRMLAEAFAMLLTCESPRDGEPCMECISCRQALAQSHPDIIRLTHEKASISVDDVRRQIVRSADILPYRSSHKVYIVDEAEKMNVQAQNALLKTLEEPPAYAVILLLTTNADLFLPTVLSRCVRLNLKAVDDALIREHLVRDLHITVSRADLCVAFAQGNVGRAVALASSEELGELQDRTFRLVREAADMPAYRMVQELKFLTEDKESKEDIPLFMDMLLLLFRDVLLYKSTGREDGMIFRDRADMIGQIAERSSFAGLNRIFEAMDVGNRRLRANVSTPLTLEMLMLDIKENVA